MKTIDLIGHPAVPAKKVSELRVGDRTIWNYGFIEKVLYVIKETKDTRTLCVLSEANGQKYDRRFMRDRLVGVTEEPFHE